MTCEAIAIEWGWKISPIRFDFIYPCGSVYAPRLLAETRRSTVVAPRYCRAAICHQAAFDSLEQFSMIQRVATGTLMNRRPPIVTQGNPLLTRFDIVLRDTRSMSANSPTWCRSEQTCRRIDSAWATGSPHPESALGAATFALMAGFRVDWCADKGVAFLPID
jgi:hypothetical protein